MDQKVINSVYVAMGNFAEQFSSELRNNVEALESSGDPEKFRTAQKCKEAANGLESQSVEMRKKYPHIFKEKAQ